MPYAGHREARHLTKRRCFAKPPPSSTAYSLQEQCSRHACSCSASRASPRFLARPTPLALSELSTERRSERACTASKVLSTVADGVASCTWPRSLGPLRRKRVSCDCTRQLPLLLTGSLFSATTLGASQANATRNYSSGCTSYRLRSVLPLSTYRKRTGAPAKSFVCQAGL